MALHLIKGPLNSGRTGLVLRDVIARADSGPILVAPTTEARAALEEELCERTGSILGIETMGLQDLAATVLAASGSQVPQQAGVARKLLLVRRALGKVRLTVLRRSSTSNRFPLALVDLFDELSAAGVGVNESYAHTADRYVSEVLAIYAEYRQLLTQAGLTDSSGLLREAVRCLKEDPDALQARPVCLLGFNDFAQDQFELVSALAGASPVTLSVTHEDRESLSARSSLAAELSEIARDTRGTVSDASYTGSPLLHHLDRTFGEKQAASAPYDGSVALLRAAGNRGEAEHVGMEIKRLLLGGVSPSKIVIAVRSPDTRNEEVASILGRFGIPVAASGEVPITRSAIGGCIQSLLEAACGDRSAKSLLRFLRHHPGYACLAATDDIEAGILREECRNAEQAASEWERSTGAELTRYRELAAAHVDGEDASRVLLQEALQVTSVLPRSAAELNAARTLIGLLDDLAVQQPALSITELQEMIDCETAPMESGPAGDRVRITSPYSLHTSRSDRPDHLFVIGLNEGEFPKPSREEVFLTAEQRASLGMKPPAPSEQEELYLFQACVSTPTQGLWLSSRTADDEGKPVEPSRFVEMVGELIDGGLSAVEQRDRDGTQIVFAPMDAPGERELKRSLAATYPPGETGDDETDRAAMRASESLNPRDLTHPYVLAKMQDRLEIACSALEAYCKDPGEWFVDRELRPAQLGPDPPAIRRGLLVHHTMELLFSNLPQGDGGLARADEEAWIDRLNEKFTIAREQTGFTDVDPITEAELSILLRSMGQSVRCDVGWLRLGYRPELIEAAFGSRQGCERQALELGPQLKVTGKIDRVDTREESAVVIDYKTSSYISGQKKFEDMGLLQLPLYARAARDLWGLEPMAALYRPLSTGGARARGMLNDDDGCAEAFDTFRCIRTDRVCGDEFNRLVDQAAERAVAAHEAIRSGEISGKSASGKPPRGHDVRRITRRFADRFATLDEGENASAPREVST